MKHGLLNKIRPMLWLGLCAASLGAGCSNDDSGETSELAAKVTLTLSKYYNDQGATSLVTWKSSDRGAVFAVRHGAAEPAYAAPISPGRRSRSSSSRSTRRRTPMRRSWASTLPTRPSRAKTTP